MTSKPMSTMKQTSSMKPTSTKKKDRQIERVFREGMDVIALVCSVIKDRNEREIFRVRETNKLCLKISNMSE